MLQAEDLGKLFRTVMYPRYGPAGNGFLRLHSTYRHDLKIYTSDEGRVQTSAAAFTQGLLDLEGTSLTPILVRSVSKHNSKGKQGCNVMLCHDAYVSPHRYHFAWSRQAGQYVWSLLCCAAASQAEARF